MSSGFLQGLKVFGQDIVKLFAWMSSPQGKQIVSTGEAVVEAVVPISIPIIDLVNAWIQKAFTVESLAVTANQNSDNGAQKAAMVIAAVTPQVLTYAQQSGLSPRTAAQIQAANDAAVAFINAMTDPVTTLPPTPQSTVKQ